MKHERGLTGLEELVYTLSQFSTATWSAAFFSEGVLNANL